MNDLPIIAAKLYPDEIQQIHNEFECASDKLLKEATEIIAEGSKVDTNKLSRLEALGFKQANNVKETKQLVEKTKLSKEQVQTIEYYRENYPFNKFITEEQVEIICKKYNLICGDVSRFKGFVPEKNLKEIENFKLNNQDKEIFYEYQYGSFNYSDVEKLMVTYNHPKSYFITEDNLTSGKCRIVNKELQICAPVKDMDISGMDLNKGYKLEKHIPDPVVLHHVKGGYLVLTKWGAEASDPILLNEIDN